MKPKMIKFYMNTAINASTLSCAVRNKVGCVIVKDDNIISFSWNGTPSGWDNVCEIETETGLVTKAETIHSEANALYKLAKNGISAEGGAIFVTLSPCSHCSLGIVQSGIKTVYYLNEYRDTTGLEILAKSGIEVIRVKENEL